MSQSNDRAERLRRSIGQFVRATRANVDVLSPPQADTLGVLERNGDVSIAQLARSRGVRHQSMRITVAELERAEAVERRRDPNDARGLLIRITDTGRTTLECERGNRAATIAAAINRELEPAERKQLDTFSRLLDRLTASIASHPSA